MLCFVKLLTLSLGGSDSFFYCSRKGMLKCKPGAVIIFFLVISQNAWSWKWPLEIIQSRPLPSQGHLGKCSLAYVFFQLCSLFGSLENFTEERPFYLFKGTLQPGVHSPALNFKILSMILYGVNLVKFALV